jgi:hypothetical protein
MFSKALKYLNANRPEKALPLFKKCTPFKEVLSNIGTCYRLLGNDKKAEEYYLKAIDPSVPWTDGRFTDRFAIALNNLGLLAYTYEDDNLAIDLYLEALKDVPDYADALWNMGNALFRQYCSHKYDDLSVCWDYYEYRLKKTDATKFKTKRDDLIQWEGDKVKHLVVLAEQGFGDQIMFGRYLDQAAERCEKLTVQCAPRMAPIFDKYNTCEDSIDATHGIGICSLGKIFNSDIPAGDWLREKHIRKPLDTPLHIGVTWSGNTSHANDKYRSCTSGIFKRMADYGNLYTLNPTEVGTAGFTGLKCSGWQDTIDELAKVDLVVCVDTSIAHLCGAMGKPCWVLMPLKNTDFRWGDSSMGEKNIWYDSVRVFRNPGSWDVVMKEVCDELKKLSNGLRAL